MQISIPTTSTKLSSILSSSQKSTFSEMLKNRQGSYRCEAHGGTAWWFSRGTAVVDECNSILENDIEFISPGIDDIEFIASGSGVTINIDIA